MFKLQPLVAALLPLFLIFATTASQARPGVAFAELSTVEADTMTRPGVV